jgi:hypothetical protein
VVVLLTSVKQRTVLVWPMSLWIISLYMYLRISLVRFTLPKNNIYDVPGAYILKSHLSVSTTTTDKSIAIDCYSLNSPCVARKGLEVLAVVVKYRYCASIKG